MEGHRVVILDSQGRSAVLGCSTNVPAPMDILVTRVVDNLASAFIHTDVTPLNVILHPDLTLITECLTLDIPHGACCDEGYELVWLILAEMKKAQGLIDSIQ